MLVSYNWLKQYVSLPASVTPEKVAHQLTMSTVEVEGIKKAGADLENIVVGKVLSVEKHPNADKLKVCQVDIGSEKLQIVCGGSNVRERMLCAVAKIGAKVYWHAPPPIIKSADPIKLLVGGHGTGEPVEMKQAEIRGVKSFGMICASAEIGLGEMFPQKEEKDILDFTNVILAEAGIHKKNRLDSRFHGNDNLVGMSLSKVLNFGDTIFEIDNKSVTNRPDLWGHYGLAREVAALFRQKLRNYKIAKITKFGQTKLKIEIKDKENCFRYVGAMVGGIKIAPSPKWMRDRLIACGVRPINNVVDITNYVTLELGRPSHAFDRRDIKGDTIIVRRAKQGEKFTTLDGQARTMTDQMCLVCDAERAVDLAGIMGGLNSEIKEDTTEIILELANFNPVNIRRTANALCLRTEAAVRFEKGLSPYLAEVGMWRIITLIKELIPGAYLMSRIIDVNYQKERPRAIALPMEFLDKKIGLKMQKKTVIDILRRLGFMVKEKKDILSVTVPPWRPAKDISTAEDLVEEVARIYGYGNIKTQLPVFPIIPPQENKLMNLAREARIVLSQGLGFSEVYNYSFVSLNQIKNLGDDEKKYLELENPISKETPFLRRHLLSGLLDNLGKNTEFFPEVKIFEIGKTFWREEKGESAGDDQKEFLPKQDTWLTAVYANKNQIAPFWQARRVMEALGAEMSLQMSLHTLKQMQSWQHSGRSGAVKIEGKEVGAVYEVNPKTLDAMDIQTRVGVLEINLDKLAVFTGENNVKYEPLPVFPEVTRDLAIIVKKDVAHDEIKAEILKTDPLVKKVELFDFYAGDRIEKDSKSLAYHLTFFHSERTLTTAEVDAAQEKIIKRLLERFSAQIRN
ncbi:MAG: phenylalanine--tRNA ligase subunit beta [bacterium]|nr:phenylalanine--tRNA ligase subunit beta [bacterium]